jgi:putative transposase
VRRACTLFSVARSALRYQGRKAARDSPVIERMKELSAQYPRYGYRRIRIFLGRDGYRMSPGRAHRLWRAARLQVPRRRPKKRIAAARPRPQAPCGPNQVWSYDFVFDHCANGQQLKCLTVTDEFTKEGLAIEVDGRIRSARVIEVLSRLVSARGVPTFLRSDNGPEFVSKALLSWIVAQDVGMALIDPGKPWQNGVTESFNGKFRDECLSLEWFRSRAEAKVIIEAWRRHYNEVRPHSSLDYLTPNEFAARATSTASRQATGRDAAVHGASASRPVAQPSLDKGSQRGKQSQAKRGPENPGRSNTARKSLCLIMCSPVFASSARQIQALHCVRLRHEVYALVENGILDLQ